MKQRKPTGDEAAQAIARALADPQRYGILKLLARCEGGRTQCSVLRDSIALAPPTLSHHMRELRDAGLIQERRIGRTVQYTLRRDTMAAFLEGLERDLLS